MSMTNVSPGPPVLTFEHEVASGLLVAEARLNCVATLNALSLEMIDLLIPAVSRWAHDDRVVAVILSGAGERAFCAGGDIQALYRAMQINHQAGERVDEYPYEFFEREYRLDYCLHTYPKPLIVLGHGVIMGGGLGLFRAADVRLVTENVRIAMPEVTIGLFPDAGGTWLLKKLKEHQALFLGLTGAYLNAADAMFCGLATHAESAAGLEGLLEEILQLEFNAEPGADLLRIETLLASRANPELPEAQLTAVDDSLSADGSLMDVVSRVRALAGQSTWIDRAIASMDRGCPATAGVVLEQIRRGHSLDLADSFRMEMTIATHCADNHDFSEGIRALLIDKDNRPAWQFTDLESLPWGYVESHFNEPWAENPLHDLGNLEEI